MSFLKIFVVGAQSYGCAKKPQNKKNWPLTSIISARQQDPTNFYIWICLGLWVLLFELIKLMGSCWRIELWGLENDMRALFVQFSGQRNLDAPSRSHFFIFTFHTYPTGSFIKCFTLVGMSLAHIFTFGEKLPCISRGLFCSNFNDSLRPNQNSPEFKISDLFIWYESLSSIFF